MRSLVYGALLSCALLSCGPGVHEIDVDGGDAADAVDVGAPSDASDASTVDADVCTDEGYFYCTPMGHQCCGGHWIVFFDGPCFNVGDGGMADCATSPNTPGCPCATEGERQCRPFHSILECRSGHWAATDHACCP